MSKGEWKPVIPVLKPQNKRSAMENDVSKVQMCLNINVTLIPHFSFLPSCFGAHSLRVQVGKCKDWIKRDPRRGMLEFCSERHGSVSCHLLFFPPADFPRVWSRIEQQ